MANKKITDLMSGTPVRDSLLESAININGTMVSRKVKAGVVADLASANVAAPYDSTVTYAIGQYCLYEGDIYRCIAITTGAFDSTAWTQIVVTGEFRRVVELTSAQYGALSSAEKNNGTLYILTDEETTAADIPYSSGVSVEDKLDSLTTYSTTEQAVGTWINGKTIYQKTVSIGALPNNATVGYEVVGEAIETLVDISIIATDTTGNYFIVLPNLSSNSAFQISYDVEIDNGKTKVFIVTARDVTSYSGVVTIRYTKR